jgi:starch synthase
MKILIASPEAVPYIKTGGLADVAGALCREFRKMDHEARIVLPLYKKIKEGGTPLLDTNIVINVPVGDRIVGGSIFSDTASNIFIECDEFFSRPELYGTPEGDYVDNASRFVFFSRGILDACKALGFDPDIVHCNDWQTGLVPLYLKTIYAADQFFRNTATLLTIHNLGYQGLFPASDMPVTNISRELFTPEGIEFYGKINFLKAGLLSADILSTVSVTYAREILEEEQGFGLDGLLRKRADSLFGVINGIDYDEWDPAADRFIPVNYSRSDTSGKAVCKSELLKSQFKTSKDLASRDMPLVGMVTRLSDQKGLDLVIDSMPRLLSGGVRLVVLGKGDKRYHKSLAEISARYRGKLSVTIGFDEKVAHRVYAGSDFFLMPSKYEPCGLGQLISERYGSIPVARRTGGLADTIQDFEPLTSSGTGFLFSDYTSYALQDALKRAFCVYTDDGKKKKMMQEAMKKDFSWRKSALRYIELYRAALRKKRPCRHSSWT